MKFFCDVNVYRLAKYLRFAGFDTMTRKELSIQQISYICKKEKRIFITRKKKSAKGLFCNENNNLPKIEVLDYDSYLQQIKSILTKYPINHNLIATRCLKCNVLLKQFAENPDKPTILYCSRCGKKFWKGTHYLNMLKVVESLNISH